MADVMVTGRMSKAKKEAGNRILRSMGISASQAINQLYDYLIEEKELPFSQKRSPRRTKAQARKAASFVDSIPVTNAFSSMTDEEIRRHKIKMLIEE